MKQLYEYSNWIFDSRDNYLFERNLNDFHKSLIKEYISN